MVWGAAFPSYFLPMFRLLSYLFLLGLLTPAAFGQAPAARVQQATPACPAIRSTATMQTSTTTTARTKADGSPDMRYKENKTAKTTTVTGPTRKDGAADMRYKANKTTRTTTTKTTGRP